MTYDEYETLIDKRDFDAAMADDNEIFPASLIDELLMTDSKIRTWRKYRKLSQEQLGEIVGCNKEYIAFLESGKRGKAENSFKQIAQALNVDIDDLT